MNPDPPQDNSLLGSRFKTAVLGCGVDAEKRGQYILDCGSQYGKLTIDLNIQSETLEINPFTVGVKNAR